MPTTIRFSLQFSGTDVFDQQTMAERLLSQAGSTDHAVRARLQAILAATCLTTSPRTAAAAASESHREAKLAGDRVSHAWALVATCVVDVSPTTLDGRLSMTREVLTIAQETNELEFVQTAYFLHLGALAEQGAIDELDLALSPTGTFLSAFPWLNDERHVEWFRCLRATIDGQEGLAETMAGNGMLAAQRIGDPDGESVWVGQLAIIRWMQGRVVELEPAFLAARRRAPHEAVWAVSLAWMWLQQGRRSAAHALITTLPPVAELPIDRNWLATTCILAVVAAELRELDIAQSARDALLPFEDRLVTIGLGVTCWGTVSRPLALVAAALGDTDAAITHYRRALAFAARIGAHPWLAEAQTELAAILAGRSGSGDAEEAIALATEAVAAGRALQLRGAEEAAAVVLASVTASRNDPRGRPDLHSLARIRVMGAFEVISEQGVVAQWRSRKARQLLKILVAKRGVAVSRETVMHLLWPDEPPQSLSNRFSVAATTVRRALDPTGALPKDAYLELRGPLVRLRIDRIDVDVETFLTEARAALAPPMPADTSIALLARALSTYHGDVLADEPGELWAHDLEREVHIALFAVSHALAEAAEDAGDQLTRVDRYRSILALDEYDQRAHEGLIDALTKLGASGQAMAANAQYSQRMAELGISTTAG